MMDTKNETLVYDRNTRVKRFVDISEWEDQLLTAGYILPSPLVRTFMEQFSGLEIIHESGLTYANIKCEVLPTEWQFVEDYVGGKVGEQVYYIGEGRAGSWIFLSQNGVLCSEMDGYIFYTHRVGDDIFDILDAYIFQDGEIIWPTPEEL